MIDYATIDTMEDRANIFYVEDDEHIRDLTSYALRQVGHNVQAFPDGEGFVARCAAEQPQLILLDIMLPGDDGLEILRQLRANPLTEHIPVMMLTAKGTEYDAVVGLDAGADDYLAKPFGMMELVSRVNALLRRAARPSAAVSEQAGKFEGETLSVGSISLNIRAHRVLAGGKEVPLTLKEFDLLRTLMEHKGHVLTRDQLLAGVWKIHYAGGTRTVDAHVKTLRQKLAAVCPGADAQIATVRGVGYVFNGDPS